MIFILTKLYQLYSFYPSFLEISSLRFEDRLLTSSFFLAFQVMDSLIHHHHQIFAFCQLIFSFLQICQLIFKDLQLYLTNLLHDHHHLSSLNQAYLQQHLRHHLPLQPLTPSYLPLFIWRPLQHHHHQHLLPSSQPFSQPSLSQCLWIFHIFLDPYHTHHEASKPDP